MNGSVQVPGPGSAMALFAAVAIYTAGFATLSSFWRWVFLFLAGIGVMRTLYIERLHASGDENKDGPDKEYRHYAVIDFSAREYDSER